ncbi:hypothetical protein AVEN_169919-1 [Araneus ventricosus]|uniref:Uncharacterized protein n=1 Tax=Araneus ventricosus TaxID=182803 RepID=A0A4Y2EXZ5_ARAVE|nr:hypothetical protein AVEN_169919-1 [Araneus ventricosus]
MLSETKTQLSTRLMDFTDLKLALAYSMKYEAAKTALKTSMHARPIKLEDNAGKGKDEKFESVWERWKNYWTNLLLEGKTFLDGIRM